MRAAPSGVTLVATPPMNPDKLFDYLEGKLPEWERVQLEKQIADDPRLQKEFAAARRIHSNMAGDSREILLPGDEATNAQGRKMALRIGVAFLVLMGVNVAAGLWFIAHHEAANPNRPLLEAQMRDQITKSLQQATQTALTPPPLDLSELTLSAAPGQMNRVADQVVAMAQRLGGSATKELPDGNRIGVLADVPAQRESEFRAALAAGSGATPSPVSPNESPAGGMDKKRFIVYVMENAAP